MFVHKQTPLGVKLVLSHDCRFGVYASQEDEQHVVPLNDTVVHYVSEECWCEPDYEDDIWVHHAHDGRDRPSN